MSRSEMRPLHERGPLRVMFVITSMPVGGAETLLVNLVRAMDRSRYMPQVCCLKERGPLGEEIADEVTMHSQLISGKFDVSVIPRLWRIFKRERTDAVITVGAGDKMFWGRLAAKQAGVPVIISSLHSTGWPDEIGRLNRWLTPITDAFVAVAQNQRQFLIDHERLPGERVHVIKNGIDVDRFQFDVIARQNIRLEFGIPEHAPVCGIIAALRPEKNHLLFLRAARQLVAAKPDSHFLVVGDGPERAKLTAVINQTPLESRVHFAGARADIPEMLSAMDIFSLTSHNEASPVSILEAMATGLPVVATDVGSVSESVIDGATGYLVERGDAEQFARYWRQLLNDSDRADALGREARAQVLKHGSLLSMVEGYGELIEQIYQSKVHGFHPVEHAEPEAELVAGVE